MLKTYKLTNNKCSLLLASTKQPFLFLLLFATVGQVFQLLLQSFHYLELGLISFNFFPGLAEFRLQLGALLHHLHYFHLVVGILGSHLRNDVLLLGQLFLFSFELFGKSIDLGLCCFQGSVVHNRFCSCRWKSIGTKLGGYLLLK